jgi:4a-hydroxytetrahydrobiopterin dehydratase
VLIGDQVSAVHERAAPHFKSAFAGCGHCAAHATVGNGPKAAMAAPSHEAEELRGQAPEWALMDEAHRIERTFRFRDFREALTFVQKVGDLAESEGHHPDVSFGWGYATVSLRTKKIKGLHESDFIMAAKIDRFAQPPNG